ncbi:hypothetical protein LGH82_29895 [Mesorhizobium sp. PAMC28654]|uniref:hypothetical protein n=1 Tax=Mesorhizobium sp. PAMC28654 TaxID=2880934 RepID=UPI001D0A2DB9|nr:hypothetical protein [Mesorhizobium sp. PAMC28654]UDL89235.1 hypothetical protein LGH82_29895 [Mesorhizobium sp. PAMC28654]
MSNPLSTLPKQVQTSACEAGSKTLIGNGQRTICKNALSIIVHDFVLECGETGHKKTRSSPAGWLSANEQAQFMRLTPTAARWS